jgi:hypothetical protein
MVNKATDKMLEDALKHPGKSEGVRVVRELSKQPRMQAPHLPEMHHAGRHASYVNEGVIGSRAVSRMRNWTSMAQMPMAFLSIASMGLGLGAWATKWSPGFSKKLGNAAQFVDRPNAYMRNTAIKDAANPVSGTVNKIGAWLGKKEGKSRQASEGFTKAANAIAQGENKLSGFVMNGIEGIGNAIGSLYEKDEKNNLGMFLNRPGKLAKIKAGLEQQQQLVSQGFGEFSNGFVDFAEAGAKKFSKEDLTHHQKRFEKIAAELASGEGNSRKLQHKFKVATESLSKTLAERQNFLTEQEKELSALKPKVGLFGKLDTTGMVKSSELESAYLANKALYENDAKIAGEYVNAVAGMSGLRGKQAMLTDTGAELKQRASNISVAQGVGIAMQSAYIIGKGYDLLNTGRKDLRGLKVLIGMVAGIDPKTISNKDALTRKWGHDIIDQAQKEFKRGALPKAFTWVASTAASVITNILVSKRAGGIGRGAGGIGGLVAGMAMNSVGDLVGNAVGMAGNAASERYQMINNLNVIIDSQATGKPVSLETYAAFMGAAAKDLREMGGMYSINTQNIARHYYMNQTPLHEIVHDIKTEGRLADISQSMSNQRQAAAQPQQAQPLSAQQYAMFLEQNSPALKAEGGVKSEKTQRIAQYYANTKASLEQVLQDINTPNQLSMIDQTLQPQMANPLKPVLGPQTAMLQQRANVLAGMGANPMTRGAFGKA